MAIIDNKYLRYVVSISVNIDRGQCVQHCIVNNNVSKQLQYCCVWRFHQTMEFQQLNIERYNTYHYNINPEDLVAKATVTRVAKSKKYLNCILDNKLLKYS